VATVNDLVLIMMNLILRPSNIKLSRLFFAILMMFKMFMEIYDIVGAYLEAILKNKQYMRLPKELKGKLVLLKKALYGLHESGREFYKHLEDLLRNKVGLNISGSDPCLYFHREGEHIVIVCIYVDDILIIGSKLEWIHRIRDILGNYLKELKTIHDPKKYLGVYFDKVNDDFILLHQSAYIKGIAYGNFNAGLLKMPFDNRVQRELVNRSKIDDDKVYDKIYNELGTGRFAADRCHPEIAPHLSILAALSDKADKYTKKYMDKVFDYLKSHHHDGLLLGGKRIRLRFLCILMLLIYPRQKVKVVWAIVFS
jgi:hypothetical protein